MKNIFLTILFCLIITILSSQGIDLEFWNNIRNSSFTENDSILIRCETVDIPGLETNLFYYDGNHWESKNMESYLGLTYQAKIPHNLSETRFCRFKTETDTLIGMMPSYFAVNGFPPDPNYLSFVAEDVIGDTVGYSPENLDLTGYDFGFSDTRFYAGLENVSDSFPLNSGGIIPDEYYFYLTAIINPENVLIDSVSYFMLYSQTIPMVIGPGLYRVQGTEFSLDAIEQIGDIETEIIDGKLMMACDITTLTQDEFFGDWPNLSNSLLVTTFTGKYAFPSDIMLADYTTFSVQNIKSYAIEPFTNILPEITNVDYSIDIATSSISFDYTDADQHFPLSANVFVDSSIFQMHPQSFDYSQPVTFSTTFPYIGWEEATIRISDNNMDFVEYTINSTKSSEDEIAAVSYQLTNYPNPFNPTTTISFDITAKDAKNAKLEIFNLKGQKIRILEYSDRVGNKATESLSHSLIWNGRDDNDQPVASGVYFYKLKNGNETVASNRMLLLK